MTTPKLLPAYPSLESLRKQAKKLARDVAAGDTASIARARAHLPDFDAPLTQRNAQLVIAREYGYAGWQALTAEVSRRLGRGLEWAVMQARRLIHDNDVEHLRQLLAEYPALLSRQEDGGLLAMATAAYGDAGDTERERWFTRAACAELLIDAGAVVTPQVCEGLLVSRASGLLQLFQRHGLLPRTLKFLAALGDIDAVRADLAGKRHDPATVNEAFVRACSFEHEVIASMLLERLIALDPELGKHVDENPGRRAFVEYFIEHRPSRAIDLGPWKAFVMEQIIGAINDDDLTAFVGGLERASWLLGNDWLDFQNRLIEVAALNDRGKFIAAFLDLDPAILRHRPPPRSQAIEFAFVYANTHLMPLLTRIWPLPDDLPHAAGMGNLKRVQQWFDESGAPAGDLHNHYPYNDARARSHLGWDPPTTQQVLDVALAFAVTNDHFDVADFLLARGADINTRWNSHEPASLLHHLVFNGTYESMQFVIDRGIDMTIKDYRWNATAAGWAAHARNDPKMAQWLVDADKRRQEP
ncbi:MAG TPA: hypothetical protein VGO61_11100 [Steroidobacteraceae bacterium]|jgi:hypothetical protein|nr:hypothetical protein [Steroidobacteraceae bacterium]